MIMLLFVINPVTLFMSTMLVENDVAKVVTHIHVITCNVPRCCDMYCKAVTRIQVKKVSCVIVCDSFLVRVGRHASIHKNYDSHTIHK